MNSTPLITDEPAAPAPDAPAQTRSHASVSSPPVITVVQALGLIVCYLTVWLLTHLFRGLDHDGQLYAFQALARLSSGSFATDLFLGKGSQDNYTIFTPIYARLIQGLGLPAAVTLLLITCQFALFTSAWWIASRIFDKRVAWLAVGMLIVIEGYYGGRYVFKFSEEFVTARTPAEAIGLTGIAIWLYRHRTAGLIACSIATVLHPLMGFPCLAIVALSYIPLRHWPKAIGAGVSAVALVFLIAAKFPIGPLSIMDGEWLRIVSTRSSFLFSQYWMANDWNRIALELSTLAIAWHVRVAQDACRVRELILGAGLVGIAGLLLTAASSQWLPVHILMMGQPWRWMWVPALLAILLAAPTIVDLLKSDGTRRWVGLLLIASWLIGDRGGGIVAAAAIAGWIVGSIENARYAKYVRYMGLAACTFAIVSLAMQAVMVLAIRFSMGAEPLWIEITRNVFGIQLVSALAILACWYLVVHRWVSIPATLIVFLGAFVLGSFAPSIAHQFQFAANYSRYANARADFDTWRRTIPIDTNVFWLSENIGTWILLERPSYLSVSSSAGVVFSRDSAVEVMRRAQNLNPYVDAEYMLGVKPDKPDYEPARKLTGPILHEICQDPALGFVVSRADAGPSMRNRSLNPDWKDYKLYNCDLYRKAQS